MKDFFNSSLWNTLVLVILGILAFITKEIVKAAVIQFRIQGWRKRMRRNTILIGLLFMLTLLTACSNTQESNKAEEINQKLTQAQINEIITATNESLIQEIDFSQITKPDPEQQAEVNEKMRKLGEKLKGQVTIENTNIVVAQVNGEPITASDWYFEKASETQKAENKKKRIPPDKEILNNLIQDKVINSEARKLGLYPPEEQLEAYLADQRNYMEKLQLEEIKVFLKAWGVSEEEYLLLMRDRFTSSLAKANWGNYLDKYGDAPEAEHGYVAKSPLRIGDDKIKPLLAEAKVEVSSEGRQLGLDDTLMEP